MVGLLVYQETQLATVCGLPRMKLKGQREKEGRAEREEGGGESS